MAFQDLPAHLEEEKEKAFWALCHTDEGKQICISSDGRTEELDDDASSAPVAAVVR